MNGEIFGYLIPDQYLALAMVITLFAFLMAGFPVAFTLGGVSVFFCLVGLDLKFLGLFGQRVFGIVENTTLLAAPLFVFMGVMLERSKIAEDLLEAMTTLFGSLRSGMALAVIFSGAILAASTGIVGASVVTMGLISLPVMLKRGYSPAFSSGLICAAGTLGQIVPPSIILILLGDIMGVSVGDLFLAAVMPGLLLVVGFALYAILYCAVVKPPLNIQNDKLPRKELLRQLFFALFAPGLLVLCVLGSIFLGIASPTEAAAVGAFGATLLSILYRRFSRAILYEVMGRTRQLTCMIFTILIGAQAFGLVFRGLSGDDAIRELVLAWNVSPSTFLALIMVLFFVLGCFLDFVEIIFIVVPILTPLIAALGFDKLWFAVLIGVNLQMSFLTPPFGFALFFLKGVAPAEVKTSVIYRGVIPWIGIQAVVLAIIIFFPQLVFWLPDLADS